VYLNVSSFVHVFSRETYNSLTKWLTDARALASPNIIIVLVGNKKDLDVDREVTFLEASRFAQENGAFSSQYLQLWGLRASDHLQLRAADVYENEQFFV